jgi:hypothetical protein
LEVTYGHFSVVLYPLYVTRQRCFFELPFWNLLYHLIVSFLDPTSILFCLLITPCQNLWCILCGWLRLDSYQWLCFWLQIFIKKTDAIHPPNLV